MNHRHHGNHLGHWFHLGHALWHTEKGGVLPALGLIVLGFFLAPMLIGVPMMIFGVIKLIKAFSG